MTDIEKSTITNLCERISIESDRNLTAEFDDEEGVIYIFASYHYTKNGEEHHAKRMINMFLHFSNALESLQSILFFMEIRSFPETIHADADGTEYRAYWDD